MPLVLHCLSNCRRVVMRSDYGEGELRKALGIDVGAGTGSEAEGAERHLPERSSERSLEGGGGNANSRPLLLFPCPGAEYLEVRHFARMLCG